MDQRLVEGEHPGRRGGQRDATGLGLPLPDGGLAPCHVPVTRLLRAWRRWCLTRGQLQAPGEAVDMLDEVADGVRR